MFTNDCTIIPAKLIGVEPNGDYRLLCYYGFDNIIERVFNKSHFNKKSDYYLISTQLKKNKRIINISSADEYESFIKEHYEKN